MGRAIEDFKSVIREKRGLARANNFRVILPAIEGISARDFDVLCSDVNLPGRQTLTRERQYGLQTRKVAYGFAQEDISMTFTLTNDFGVKEYFEAWKNKAIDQTTFEIGYHDDYVERVTIQQLNQRNETTYECTLLEAFPTTMNTLQLNNELDGVLQLNVQLSYTNWTSNFL